MIKVHGYIFDPETGAILCVECLRECGVANEMAICETRVGYACDETRRGHFLPTSALEPN